MRGSAQAGDLQAEEVDELAEEDEREQHRHDELEAELEVAGGAGLRRSARPSCTTSGLSTKPMRIVEITSAQSRGSCASATGSYSRAKEVKKFHPCALPNRVAGCR